MAAPPGKAAGALRTIGEVSAETGIPHHILRFWETRFPQLRPLQRAGGRRYYRPDDVALVRRVDALLNRDGYTVRGVQQLLAGDAALDAPLHRIRALLADALAADALAAKALAAEDGDAERGREAASGGHPDRA